MHTILTEPITQKCAWRGADLRLRSDWIRPISTHTLAALETGMRSLHARGLFAPECGRSDYVIDDPVVLRELSAWAEELENGYGFLVLRGLDATRFSEVELATLYWLIGLYLGEPVSQNERGHMLGRVENVGDPSHPETRVYEVNTKLPYHTDMSDVVGLLSIRAAQSGGMSSVVSMATVYNAILARYPHYLAYFYHPAYYDHLGEAEPSLSPIFSYWKGKLAARYLRYYIELGHKRKGIPLSRVQTDALNIFDTISHDPALRLDMMLAPGDIQFCNNYSVMHSRTTFTDEANPAKHRKLLRLWLKMPNARELGPDFPGRNGIAGTSTTTD